MPLWSRYYLENGFAFWITHVKKNSAFNVNVTTESDRIESPVSAVMERATQWLLEFNCLIRWDAIVSIKSPWISSVLCHYSLSFETMLGLYLIIRWKWCNAYAMDTTWKIDFVQTNQTTQQSSWCFYFATKKENLSNAHRSCMDLNVEHPKIITSSTKIENISFPLWKCELCSTERIFLHQ